MAFLEPKLNLKVQQKQVLTPGLVQMVSLLTLNKLELTEMIQQELVQNPVLEEGTEIVENTEDDREPPGNPNRAAVRKTSTACRWMPNTRKSTNAKLPSKKPSIPYRRNLSRTRRSLRRYRLSEFRSISERRGFASARNGNISKSHHSRISWQKLKL